MAEKRFSRDPEEEKIRRASHSQTVHCRNGAAATSLYHILFAFMLLLICSSAPAGAWNGQVGSLLFDQAQQAIAKGDYGHAIEIYRKLILTHSDSAPLYLQLGIAEFQNGDYRPAALALQHAIDLQPKLQVAEAFLGLAEAALGDPQHSIPLLKKSFRSNNGAISPELKRTIGLRLGKLYTNAGQLNDAEEVYLALLREFPDDPQALYDNFWFDMTRARKIMRELLQNDSNSYLTHEMLGQLLAENQNYAAAAKQFRLALTEDPTGLGLHYELGNMLLAMSPDGKSAASEYQEELRLHPSHVASYCRLAQLAYRSRDLNRSWNLYGEALRFDPHNVNALVGLSEICLTRNQPLDALAYSETAVKLNAESPTAHYLLARIYRKLGHADQAKVQMEVFQKLKSEQDAEIEYLSSTRVAGPQD
ncbi:MAG: tetratricopeptide repeat protein [Terriglobia bacterium]